MRSDFHAEATDGGARAGSVTTPGGPFRTPCFMPVGTRGAVRHLSSMDLADLGAEVVLANTYHLMLRPGADVVRDLGGLGAFAAWTASPSRTRVATRSSPCSPGSTTTGRYSGRRTTGAPTA
jgi:queuine/archaeosine tRNA-ribosyltransferase